MGCKGHDGVQTSLSSSAPSQRMPPASSPDVDNPVPAPATTHSNPLAPAQGPLTVTRHARWQANVLEGSRPSGLGSSACGKIAAQSALAAIFLKKKTPTHVGQLTESVKNCVRDWDKHGACDGGMSADTVLCEAKRHKKHVTLPVRDAYVNRETLAVMLANYAIPFSAILTAIPNSANYESRNWVGNTFALNFTHDGVWIFDSHEHPRTSAPLKGMVLARGEYAPSQKRKSIQHALSWIFDTLLLEMSCHQAFLVVTIVVPKDTPPVAVPPAASATNNSITSASSQGVGTSVSPSASCKHHPTANTKRDATATSSSALRPVGAAIGPAVAKAPSVAIVPNVSIPTKLSETDDEHRKRHQRFTAGCSHCLWLRHREEWQRRASFTDATTRQLVSSITRGPPDLGGFRIGCVVCAAYVRHSDSMDHHAQGGYSGHKNPFALFTVEQPSAFQLSHIKQHCASKLHLKALRWRQSPPAFSQLSSPPPLGEIQASPDDANAVPSVERFLWAMSLPSGAASNRSFQQFVTMSDLSSMNGSSTHDRAHKQVRKMQRSVGAVLHNDHVDLTQRAKRLFFSFDDMDQINTLRVRVSFMQPTVGSREFFADAILDFGFDIEDQANVVRRSLQQLCVKSTAPPKSGGRAVGVHPASSAVDPERWAHVQAITTGGDFGWLTHRGLRGTALKDYWRIATFPLSVEGQTAHNAHNPEERLAKHAPR